MDKDGDLMSLTSYTNLNILIMKIELKQIKQIASKITEDDSWVNDSHTSAEYNGICYGINTLIEKLENQKL